MLNAIGLSINTITLFALVLAIGLVVDDAIVVVENVARLLGEGLPRREAVRRSMGEVTSAIVASTLVLGAVFVPVAFLPGTTGLLLRQFGLAVTCAVLISLLNALTLSPALCALLMRPRARAEGLLLPRLRPRLRRPWCALRPRRARAAAAPRHWCSASSRRSAPRPLLLFRVVPTGFLPDEDQGYFITSFQLPDGASLERSPTSWPAGREDPARRRPGIVGANLFGGFDVLTGTFPAERRLGVRHARALERARGERASRSIRSSPRCDRSSRRSRKRA